MAAMSMAGLLPRADDPAHFQRLVWETGLGAVWDIFEANGWDTVTKFAFAAGANAANVPPTG